MRDLGAAVGAAGAEAKRAASPTVLLPDWTSSLPSGIGSVSAPTIQACVRRPRLDLLRRVSTVSRSPGRGGHPLGRPLDAGPPRIHRPRPLGSADRLAASFRSDEIHRRHPLQPFLGEVQRARSTERIDLSRFSEDEVAEQVSAMLGETASPEVVDRIFKRSDGNAFYAEELVVAETSGTGLPPAMRDMLLARVASLSDPARELLRIVAAGGTRVSTAVVARVAGARPQELDTTLREAVDRHLLRPVDEDGAEFLQFRHALVQEAVYAELLPGERSRLHARYGSAFESGHRPGDALSPS